MRRDVWRILAEWGVPINHAVREGLRIIAARPELLPKLVREAERGERLFTRAALDAETREVAERMAQELGVSLHALLNAAAVAYIKSRHPYF